jgi:general secretion pathway protein A
MYRSHWGLRESPYRDGHHARYFYKSPVQDEALARLHFLIEHHRRVGLLLGESGSGKSLLLEVFGRRLRQRGAQVARIDMLAIDARELLWQTATQWGVALPARDGLFDLWRAVSDRLIENRLQQVDCALLLDNADEAVGDVKTHIARLAQCDVSADSRLTVVLAARPERIQSLGSRLIDLAALRIDLEPWDESDTVGYLTTLLAQAGRTTSAFDVTAMSRLHALSRGIPRRVSQLADLALLAGAGQQLERIDSETVESVYRELAVPGAR